MYRKLRQLRPTKMLFRTREPTWRWTRESGLMWGLEIDVTIRCTRPWRPDRIVAAQSSFLEVRPPRDFEPCYRLGSTAPTLGRSRNGDATLRPGSAKPIRIHCRRESRGEGYLSRSEPGFCPCGYLQWTRISTMGSTCRSPSLGPDQINEYASVVVLQVGQFVGEVGEVVADAGLQVLGDVMVDRGQDAAAALIDIREAKLPDLGQGVPLLEEPPVQPKHGELRSIVEESRLH